LGIENLWNTTAMALALDFAYAVRRLQFEALELEKTGQIIRKNPLRFMH